MCGDCECVVVVCVNGCVWWLCVCDGCVWCGGGCVCVSGGVSGGCVCVWWLWCVVIVSVWWLCV